MPKKPDAYPQWICARCGQEHNRLTRVRLLVSFHEPDAKDPHDKCGWCGTNKVPLTEPRDYGYPIYPVRKV